MVGAEMNHMATRIALLSVLVLSLSATPAVVAGPATACGVSFSHTAYTNVAYGAQRVGKRQFSVHLNNCTYGVIQGSRVDACLFVASSMNIRTFWARNTDALTSGTANDVCRFACDHATSGGPCQFEVNLINGLPVELMAFGVDDHQQ